MVPAVQGVDPAALAPMVVREARALDNCRRAIDLHEITERGGRARHVHR